jgi:hypothetical protein
MQVKRPKLRPVCVSEIYLIAGVPTSWQCAQSWRRRAISRRASGVSPTVLRLGDERKTQFGYRTAIQIQNQNLENLEPAG